MLKDKKAQIKVDNSGQLDRVQTPDKVFLMA